jgi:hypothetical protein
MSSLPTDSLRIPYQSEDFPLGSNANWPYELPASWDDVLWAAVTVGRRNIYYVFRYAGASIYEALFRWSLTRMALEQSGPTAYRLRMTEAAKNLDPTEKGAVNYFLGMTFCKLFASKLLNTPWVLHLDVSGKELNAVLTGRSRPDLIGEEHGGGKWHAFECKGRSSPPDKTVKEKAKRQAQRLVSVNGISCSLHIGAITHFSQDVLQFYWRDPVPERGKPIEVSLPANVWRYYYEPVTRLVAGHQNYQRSMQERSGVLMPVADLDIQVGIHPLIARPLFHGQWDHAREMALRETHTIIQDGYQRDGLIIKAGDSWRRRFVDTYFTEG